MGQVYDERGSVGGSAGVTVGAVEDEPAVEGWLVEEAVEDEAAVDEEVASGSTSILESLFVGCTSLANVELDDNETLLGDEASPFELAMVADEVEVDVKVVGCVRGGLDVVVACELCGG